MFKVYGTPDPTRNIPNKLRLFLNSQRLLTQPPEQLQSETALTGLLTFDGATSGYCVIFATMAHYL